MRIAVDARELCGRPTGVGRYLSALLEEWADSATGRRHQWALYAHAPPPVPRAFAEHVRVVPGSGGTKWQQWDLARALGRDRPDVVFAPGYSAPLSASAPVVLTVHDVSYFDHPEWFSAREGWRLRAFTRWSAHRARIVLTDSEFSQRQIVHHLGVPAARTRLVHLGIRRPGVAAASHLHREPIVLYVGSIFERRHVDWLIESFDAVANRVAGVRLEIVGENRTSNPGRDLDALRRRSAHADRIALRSYVDEPTLADLYARASVFAFMSEYEGFGFTPLEALAAGVPPVSLDTPVAREICGAAARYVAASPNHTQLIEALVDLLSSASARQAILQQAPATLARYNWSDAASATLAAIEEAAGGV
jgi:glycosyltransferase involved in cell wall biosynthesis